MEDRSIRAKLALRGEALEKKLSRSDRPYVTLKAAISLDGKIAARGGASQWITGEAARGWGHQLRAMHDGIMVGIGTVLADDSRLTARIPGADAQPARIVLDSRCRIPPTAHCLTDDGASRIVIVGQEAPEERCGILGDKGVEIWRCAGHRPSPSEFLPRLRRLGIEKLLVEGGGQVHANLIANREADELFLFIAGSVIGGSDAPGWCGDLNVARPEQAPRLQILSPEIVGDDLLVRGIFQKEDSGQRPNTPSGENI